MFHQLFFILFCSISTIQITAQVIGSTCNSSSSSQIWNYNVTSGKLQSSSPGLPCLTLSSFPGDGTQLLMSPCLSEGSGSDLQSFDFITGNLIVARLAPTKCVNLAGYGTSPGTIVWGEYLSYLPSYFPQLHNFALQSLFFIERRLSGQDLVFRFFPFILNTN